MAAVSSGRAANRANARAAGSVSLVPSRVVGGGYGRRAPGRKPAHAARRARRVRARGAGTEGLHTCQPIAVFNAITKRLALCHYDHPRRLDDRLAVVVGWVAGGYHASAHNLGRDTVIWLIPKTILETKLRSEFTAIAVVAE